MKEESGALRRGIQKLYGGLAMPWRRVILLAVGSAVVTAVFLLLPVFENTSFRRMGETLEAWIFLAVILMANCASPRESAVKTFVFFLISQPLIYLLQVPFSALGWGLFGYYKYWFLWTLLTLPMAYAGWYIKKQSWLSLLILAPVLLLLSYTAVSSFRFTAAHFPRQLVTALFCLGQVLVYLWVFTRDRWQKLAGLAVPVIAALVLLFSSSRIDISSTQFLPDEPELTEAAAVTVEDPDLAQVSVASYGPDSMIRIQARRLGTTAFTIRDGEAEYRYALELYEDAGGSTQIRITPLE